MPNIPKEKEEIFINPLSKEEYLTTELFIRYFSQFYGSHDKRLEKAHEFAKKIIEKCNN